MAVTYGTNHRYDHPQFVTRQFPSGGSFTAGTLTPQCYLVAAEQMNLYNVYGIIHVAGSTTTSAFDLVTVGVNGTTTTTVASTIVSSATAGQNFSIDCTTSGAGPTVMAQGSYAYVQSRLDATLSAYIAYEVGFPPTSGMVTPN